MDASDKSRITNNRIVLVKNLDVNPVLDYLIENKIFSLENKNSIMANSTAEEKVRSLLDLLVTKGPNAYSCFHKALQETTPWMAATLDGTRFRQVLSNLKVPEALAERYERHARNNPRESNPDVGTKILTKAEEEKLQIKTFFQNGKFYRILAPARHGLNIREMDEEKSLTPQGSAEQRLEGSFEKTKEIQLLEENRAREEKFKNLEADFEAAKLCFNRELNFRDLQDKLDRALLDKFELNKKLESTENKQKELEIMLKNEKDKSAEIARMQRHVRHLESLVKDKDQAMKTDEDLYDEKRPVEDGESNSNDAVSNSNTVTWLEDRLLHYQHKTLKLENDCKTKENTIRLLQCQVENMKSNHDTWKEAEQCVSKMKVELTSIKRAQDVIEQQLHSNDKNIKKLRENRKTEHDGDKKNERINQLEEEAQRMTAIYGNLQEELQTKETTISKLQTAIKESIEISLDNEALVLDVKKRIRVGNKTIQDYKNQLICARESAAADSAVIADAENTIVELENKIKALEDDKKDLQQSLQQREDTDLKQRNAAATRQIERLLDESHTQQELHYGPPLSLGLYSVGGLVDIVIPRNTELPVTVEFTWRTVSNYQTKMILEICAGERPLEQYCQHLGSLHVCGLTSDRIGETGVVVTFDISITGNLSVNAKEMGTGLEYNAVIANIKEIANKNSKFRNRFLNYLFNDTRPLYIGLWSEEMIRNTIQDAEKFMDDDQRVLVRIRRWKAIRKYFNQILYDIRGGKFNDMVQRSELLYIKEKFKAADKWLEENWSASEQSLEEKYQQLNTIYKSRIPDM